MVSCLLSSWQALTKGKFLPIEVQLDSFLTITTKQIASWLIEGKSSDDNKSSLIETFHEVVQSLEYIIIQILTSAKVLILILAALASSHHHLQQFAERTEYNTTMVRFFDFLHFSLPVFVTLPVHIPLFKQVDV